MLGDLYRSIKKAQLEDESSVLSGTDNDLVKLYVHPVFITLTHVRLQSNDELDEYLAKQNHIRVAYNEDLLKLIQQFNCQSEAEFIVGYPF